MYSTSQKWKEKIYENVQSVFNIYIDDVLIDPNYILDFKVGKTLFDDEELKLGSTSSRYIELQIYKNQVTENISQVKVDYGILINNEYEIIPIGIFNIDDYTNNDDNTLIIKCIDNMSKFEFNYDGSKLTYPTTLIQILEDICEKAGVELGSTSFLNSDTKVSVYDNTITAREYLSYISECAGGFACIGRDGKLYIRQFYQDSQEIPLELFGEYKWGEKYNISKVSYENGVESFKFGDDTGNNLWINQENMYIIEEDEVEKIYNQMKEFEAYSFEGKTIIDPALDEGDKLIIDGKSVLYQGEADFQGRFIAEISSKIAIKEKQETTVKETSQKLINRRVQSRIDEAEGKITQLVQETGENSEKISEVTQTLDEISQKVDNVQDFTNTVSGNYQLILSNAEAFPVLKLIMYGKSRDPLYLYPNSRLFPSSLLTTQGEYNKITLVIDSQSRIDPSENVREYVFKIEEQLNDYNEIHDQLVIERNVDTNLCEVKVLRYIQREGKIITVLKDPIEETVGSFEIELLEGKNYVYIKEYPYWEIDCKYLVQNDANDLYATKVEMHSSIEQTAEEINLEVRKKVDENEIISKINQSAEKISIEAEKININGVVSANDNFKIDKNGNMTCNNGTFKGGKINLSGGTKENPTFWIEDDSGNRAYFTPSGFGVGGSTNYFEFNPYNILINLDGLNWNFNRDSQRTITDNDLYVLADIHAYSYLYDSLEEKKRDITQFTDKALDIVKNGELYSFNYKGEKEETKKHIGFIIGENYKTPKEVMSTNNQAIDAYTMTSILWKAVQEQQKQIEELQNETKQMKERK